MVCLVLQLIASPHLTILKLTFFLFRKFLDLELCIVYISTWSFNNSIISNAYEGILRQGLFFSLFMLPSLLDFFSDYLGQQAKRVNFITISSTIQGYGTLDAYTILLFWTQEPLLISLFLCLYLFISKLMHVSPQLIQFLLFSSDKKRGIHQPFFIFSLFAVAYFLLSGKRGKSIYSCLSQK